MLADRLKPALARIDSREIFQPDGASPVWRITTPGALAIDGKQRRAALNDAKRRFVRDLLGAAPTCISHPDDPEDNEVTGCGNEVAPGIWRLPPTLDLDSPEVDYWLFSLGSWTMFVAERPGIGDIPDAGAIPPDALVQWMVTAGIEGLVWSGPDDGEWVVAVRRLGKP
jgi:hypothetical protein